MVAIGTVLRVREIKGKISLRSRRGKGLRVREMKPIDFNTTFPIYASRLAPRKGLRLLPPSHDKQAIGLDG